ncbi:hypothetical protein KF840_23700 [bacterium]|nr:hypothetical protein [bacterium]
MIELPRTTTYQEEMEALGIPAGVSERAYRMAREDLVTGVIDPLEINEAARRYQKQLSAS